MAKKRRAKQVPSLKKQQSKKLSKLANKLLEHYENVDALRRVGEKSDNSNLVGSLGSIFNTTDDVPKDTYSNKIQDVLKKLRTLKNLVILNISLTKDKKNFNTDEYQEDSKFISDIIFKVHASSEVSTIDLEKMNNLYKKHKRIKQLFD